MFRAVRTLVALPLLLALCLPFAAAAQSSLSPGYKFLDAVKKRDGETVEQMLGSPSGVAVINATDSADGRTALFGVVESRDETWLRYLLDQGANPNLADDRGVTPLMTSVRLGWEPGVEWLLKAGAQVDARNRAGETALIQAVQLHDLAMVRQLLRAGADPDRQDHAAGLSARDYASRDARDAEIKQLIEAQARPTRREPALDFSGEPIR